jgi:hypothetical protein
LRLGRQAGIRGPDDILREASNDNGSESIINTMHLSDYKLSEFIYQKEMVDKFAFMTRLDVRIVSL